MSDNINFQTRICPTCFDDHSAEKPCNLDDLFIEALKGLRDHMEKLQKQNAILLESIKKALNILDDSTTAVSDGQDVLEEALEKINDLNKDPNQVS